MFDELLQLPLFKGITADQLILFAGRFPLHFETLQPNEKLIDSGEISDELFFIIKGRVSQQLLMPGTKILLKEEINSPFTIPPTSFYGRYAQSVATWETITETKILRVRKNDYQKMVLSNPTMLISLLNLLANQAQMCTQFALNCSLKDLKTRFAFCVLSLTHNEADIITLNATRSSLSVALGVSSQTLKKFLEELVAKGFIEYFDRVVTIRDRGKIERLIQ